MNQPEFHTSQNPKEKAAEYLFQVLKEQLLSGKKVLWLVPGGSAISVAAEVSKKMKDMDLSGLLITLTDERYGQIGHPDSNWLQLEQSGFTMDGAHLYPVLSGESPEETVSSFNARLEIFLSESDVKIGLFGIGSDGHTAGILPGSLAVNSDSFAVGYDAGAYKRITMTPKAIEKLDAAVAYATGESKKPTLEKLKQEVTVEEQPAQALKQTK